MSVHNKTTILSSLSGGSAAPFLVGTAVGVLGTLLAVTVTTSSPPASEVAETAPKRAKSRQNSAPKESSADRYDGFSPRDASARFSSVLNTPGALDDLDRLNDLIEKAAKFDPAAAMEAASGILDPARQRDVMRRVLRTWIVQDRDSAMAAIDAMENLALRRDLTKFAIGTLAGSNPAGAFALLKATPTLRDDDLWRDSFSNWTKADPAAAMAAWEGLTHPEQRRDALRGIASAMARKDLASAIDWAKELSNKDDRDSAVISVLHSAIEKNLLAAAENMALLKEVDSDRSREVAGRIASKLAETDVSGAAEWAEKLPASQRDSALRSIAGNLMRFDPDAAEEMIGKIQDKDQRRDIFSDLARLHMTGDSKDAVKWIATLPAEDQSSAWRGAAYEWARSRPEDAAAFVLSGELDDTGRRQLIEATAEQWSRLEPESAAKWASQIGGNEGREALNRIIDEWSRKDPQTALNFVGNTAPGDQVEDLTRRVVSRWSREEPLEAANFAQALAPSPVQESMMRDITQQWMESDSMAASEWVGSLDPGPARDSAVSSLISRIEREDPEAAAQWAGTITDPNTRDETYKRLIRRLEKGK
ncbi:MAG: hypothetical protein KDN22_09340 [Verrucomicrobiae bacterium]|nr:hypothetical protein [Verrucomicrobiae bacterium]